MAWGWVGDGKPGGRVPTTYWSLTLKTGEVVETSPKQEGTSLDWEHSGIKERLLCVSVKCESKDRVSSSRHSTELVHAVP